MKQQLQSPNRLWAKSDILIGLVLIAMSIIYLMFEETYQHNPELHLVLPFCAIVLVGICSGIVYLWHQWR